MKTYRSILAIIGAILLSSCTHYSDYEMQYPNEQEQLAIDIVFSFATNKEAQGPEEVIHTKTAEEYEYYCDSTPEESAGCAVIFGSKIVASPDYPDNIELIIHEAVHFLQFSNDNYIDYKHESGRYWKSVGGSDSIQARAEVEYKQMVEGKSWE